MYCTVLLNKPYDWNCFGIFSDDVWNRRKSSKLKVLALYYDKYKFVGTLPQSDVISLSKGSTVNLLRRYSLIKHTESDKESMISHRECWDLDYVAYYTTQVSDWLRNKGITPQVYLPEVTSYMGIPTLQHLYADFVEKW